MGNPSSFMQKTFVSDRETPNGWTDIQFLRNGESFEGVWNRPESYVNGRFSLNARNSAGYQSLRQWRLYVLGVDTA